jgi:beta-lactamase regulating signal transducer with metallopeptidase domain
MSGLFDVVDAIASHFGVLAIGVSVVLALGGVALLCARRPTERRRLGGLCVGAVALYLVVATVPLPRWSPVAREPEPVADASARLAALLAATDELAHVPDPVAPPAGIEPMAVESMSGPTSGAGTFDRWLAAEPFFAVVPAVAWPWGRIGVVAWLALAAVMAMRAMVGFVRLARVLRTSRPVAGEVLAGLELPRAVAVRSVARALRPFCAWWGRPVVIVPANLLAPGRRSQLRSVLRHELAHVRAGDPTLQLLLAVLAVPLAAHPLFWWLARDVRFHAELLADDAAAAATGRERYARDLLDLAERKEPELAAAGAVPVFHRPSEFFRRIQMLLQREGRLSAPVSLVRRSVQTLAAFALVGFAAATFGVPAAAQEPSRRDLKAQNDELRAQLDALYAELATLKAMLEQQKQQAAGAAAAAMNESYLGAVRKAVSPPGDHPHAPPAKADPTSELPQAEHRTHAAHEAMRALSRLAEEGGADRPTPEQAHAYLRTLAQLAEVHPGTAPAAQPNVPTVGAAATELPEKYQRYIDQWMNQVWHSHEPLAEHRAAMWPPSGDAVPAPNSRATASVDGVAELVSRCIDLKSDLELAELEAAEAKAHHEAGVTTALERKRLQMKAAALQRKYAAVRVLVRGEIEATQQEIEAMQAEHEAGRGPANHAQVARAKARLEALQSAAN